MEQGWGAGPGRRIVRELSPSDPSPSPSLIPAPGLAVGAQARPWPRLGDSCWGGGRCWGRGRDSGWGTPGWGVTSRGSQDIVCRVVVCCDAMRHGAVGSDAVWWAAAYALCYSVGQYYDGMHIIYPPHAYICYALCYSVGQYYDVERLYIYIMLCATVWGSEV